MESSFRKEKNKKGKNSLKKIGVCKFLIKINKLINKIIIIIIF